MLNTNNKVNYEINIKQEEKKYSWSTVFAWLYLKTIGRILPKKWNKWAENILYYDKATVSNRAQTDDLKTADESVQIDLKPEVAEKESKSEVIGEDKEVQTEENSEFTDESCFDTKVNDEFIDEDYDSMEEVSTEEDVSQELELERLQNASLKKTNEDLESKLVKREEEYKKLENALDQREKELLAELEEKSEEILKLNKELIERSTEFSNKTERLLVEIEEKDKKISNLVSLNEGLDEDKKAIKDKVHEQQQTIFEKDQRIKEQDALIKSLIDKNKDINEAVKKDNGSLLEEVTELGSKVSELKGKSDTKTAYIKQLEDKLNELRQQKQELEQTQSKNAELESKVSESRKEKAQYEEQLKTVEKEHKMHEESQRELEHKLENLESQLSTAVKEKKDLENEVARSQKQVQILEESKEWESARIDDSLKETLLSVIDLLAQQLPLNNQGQQLQGKKVNLEDKLKIFISQLNAAGEEKQILEGNKAEEIERLTALKKKLDEKLQETRGKLAEREGSVEQLQKKQKQAEGQLKAEVKKLQEEKRGHLAEIDSLKKKLESSQSVALSSIQAHSGTLEENYELKIQQVENSTAEDEQQNGKLKEKDTQGQTKAHKPGAVSLISTVSTAKSITESTLSKWRNLPNKLLKNKNLERFLSDKNEELKKSFPEFKEKHFCHNVLDKTIESLLNQGDGKFESRELLKLLENNMKESARRIIEAKVGEVVNEHCNVGKNIGKELRDDTLKAKLSSSVGKCIEKLGLNKKDAAAITDSIWRSFHSRNNNNDDSGKLRKEIVMEELTEARVKSFFSKIQELQLALSIRDKLLSPDQGMCNKTQGKGNEYQLTERAKKEYIPNTSMTDTNSTASIRSLNGGRVVVRAGS